MFERTFGICSRFTASYKPFLCFMVFCPILIVKVGNRTRLEEIMRCVMEQYQSYLYSTNNFN